MVQNEKCPSEATGKPYMYYLIFMLIACGGALVWQCLMPWMGGKFTTWGDAPGWQREIALWNVGLIAAIVFALFKKDARLMRLMTLQSTILCLALGLNHLVAFLQDPSTHYLIHIMGIAEVLLLGGTWGIIALLKGRHTPKHPNQQSA